MSLLLASNRPITWQSIAGEFRIRILFPSQWNLWQAWSILSSKAVGAHPHPRFAPSGAPGMLSDAERALS